MRLVTGISIASLVVSVATLALVLVMFVSDRWESAEDTPNFTKPELERLIRQSQGDSNCFQQYGVKYWYGDIKEGRASHPTQTFEYYSFKPNGQWIVDVTGVWEISHKEKVFTADAHDRSISENEKQILQQCIYVVNDHTGAVTYQAQD